MERLALADRHALRLRFGEPCDPRRLVEIYDVECILETFTDYAAFLSMPIDEVAATFANVDGCSSLTFALCPGELVMLVNPCHTLARRTLSIAHEFGHLVRGHRAVVIGRLNGALECPRYADSQEHEANAYASALLVPYAPLLQLLEDRAPERAIAELYGVSLEALHMRLRLVGLWRSRTTQP